MHYPIEPHAPSLPILQQQQTGSTPAKASLPYAVVTNIPDRTSLEALSAESDWTLREREHAMLVHDADKYEACFYKAMKAFVLAVVVDVAVKGGLPVAQALLERYDLPLLNDGMLSGGRLQEPQPFSGDDRDSGVAAASSRARGMARQRSGLSCDGVRQAVQHGRIRQLVSRPLP